MGLHELFCIEYPNSFVGKTLRINYLDFNNIIYPQTNKFEDFETNKKQIKFFESMNVKM
jgi:hypothetical protein